MNCHGEKERSVELVYPSYVESHFKTPYKDYKLLVLISEVTAVTSMNSQPAVMMATCWLLNQVGANMQLTL